ncbi:hypothetical protein [Saccharopolyspora mangrovi]|uniref:Uncharacterized protein n=1 Tax=Saccharopolyspora mangrovi TaxID=3082379 RepID=A0ABU6A4I8_9PSEU|nr:hypothetical protein [Saccharopolyspora sp. S2-29]MEB3366492.1 hypothetical protein [Saccharopolyspora sp. S2-29]
METFNSQRDLHEAQRSLLLDAAAVMRRRYGRGIGLDHSMSPTTAERLATVFEGIARAEPALDKADRNEAIALAHRLVDDDHPEHSRMWPA